MCKTHLQFQKAISKQRSALNPNFLFKFFNLAIYVDSKNKHENKSLLARLYRLQFWNNAFNFNAIKWAPN